MAVYHLSFMLLKKIWNDKDFSSNWGEKKKGKKRKEKKNNDKKLMRKSAKFIQRTEKHCINTGSEVINWEMLLLKRLKRLFWMLGKYDPRSL